jgi:hypothetical protein
MTKFAVSDTDYIRRHLRFGWWSLLVFATLGFLLEALHGFKVRGYVGAASETRRLMWTLAHAHGTLLSVLHIVFALTLRGIPNSGPNGRRSRPVCCALPAPCCRPASFSAACSLCRRPRPRVLLVPVGAALLLTAVFLIARGAWTPVRPIEKGQKIPGKGAGG